MTSSVPTPIWLPETVEDISLLTSKFKEYSNGTRAFVVYQYGTAVFSDTSVNRPDHDYDETLLAVVHKAPDFRVTPMKDGNFLIRFSGPVCGIVLADFYNEHANEIMRMVEKGGLLPGEQLIDSGTNPSPVEHYYVGLFARAKLYRDIRENVISARYFS